MPYLGNSGLFVSSQEDNSSLLLDDLPDAICTSAWSVYKLLRPTYSGPLFRVRRASDGATKVIFPTNTRVVDIAALTKHCVGTNGFVVNVYNQISLAETLADGRIISAPSAASQPKIFDSVTGPIYNAGGKLAMQFDGVDDRLTRADAVGLTGTFDTTFVISVDNLVTNSGVIFHVGSTAGSARAYITLARVSQNIARISDQANADIAITTPGWLSSNWYTVSKPPSTGVNTTDISHLKLFQGIVDKGTGGVLNTNITLSNQRCQWGAASGPDSLFCNMKSNTFLTFFTQLDVEEMAILGIEMAKHI